MRELLSGYARLVLGDGRSDSDIAAAEARLGRRLPDDLVDYFGEVDGVYDSDGQWYVGWRLDDLPDRNELVRDELMPAGFVAFGDDGTGTPFGMTPGSPAVIVWSPIDQDSGELSPSLDEFWRGWLDGRLSS